MADKPRKIHGKAFLNWLKTFGIVPVATRYVCIEASWDSARAATHRERGRFFLALGRSRAEAEHKAEKVHEGWKTK